MLEKPERDADVEETRAHRGGVGVGPWEEGENFAWTETTAVLLISAAIRWVTERGGRR